MVALRRKGAPSVRKVVGRAAVPPEERARQRLRAAAGSLELELQSEADSELVAEAAAGVAGRLADLAKADKSADDVIFATGIFVQAMVAHLSKSLRTQSDVVLLALAHLSEDLAEFARVHPAMVDGFAFISKRQPKLASEVGEGIASWIAAPDAVRTGALVALFQRMLLVCRTARVAARAMV